MPKKGLLQSLAISATRESGGGYCARKNHIGVY